jgi:hypothetical protein
MSDDDRLRHAIRLAVGNAETGGGPGAATSDRVPC